MNINEAFPSTYLKAADLQGRRPTVIIESVDLADLDGEAKPVITFRGKGKAMILNRTNASVLAEAYGEETTAWHGKPLELFIAKVSFQGRLVDGLRVRVPAAAAAPAPQPAPQPAPAAPAPAAPAQGQPAEDLNDDIPF